MSKKDIFWNIAGSVIFALSSMLFTVATNRLMGNTIGGVFFFGMSTLGQQLLNISYLGMRPLQITDVKKTYLFGEYVFLRIIGCLISLGFGLIFLAFRQYQPIDFWVICLTMTYKIFDGFADVYECEFQRKGFLFLTGQSNAFRTLFAISIYLIVLWTSKNILLACVCLNVAAIVSIWLFNVLPLRQISLSEENKENRLKKENLESDENHDLQLIQSREKFDLAYCIKIFKQSFSLFAGGFLEIYLFSASRYAVEIQAEKALYGDYATLFMPTSVINLVTAFLVRPYISVFAQYWKDGQKREFQRSVLRLCMIIFSCGILAILLSVTLGVQVLGWIYHKNLNQYILVLLWIILGGIVNAFNTIFYYALVAREKQRNILIVYLLVFLFSLVLCPFGVQFYGLVGAAFSHFLLMFILCITFLILIFC
ncbi:hypothetical protein FACS189418_3410 [Clostridia bacterium]|nr:hypothetical protein FACS189418_3410 [Clostridia bacterium]